MQSIMGLAITTHRVPILPDEGPSDDVAAHSSTNVTHEELQKKNSM